jgi:DNA-binding transcriptional regulator YbjK
VSLATVKLVAGTKAHLLVAALQHTLTTPEASDTPVSEQAWWQQMLAERDAATVLRQFASISRSALERQADLFEVLWQAAASEPELARLDQQGSQARWQTLQQVAQVLADRQALRTGLEVETATDIIWALAAPQMYRLLVARRGWPTERWEKWLADALTVQLLAARPGNWQRKTSR